MKQDDFVKRAKAAGLTKQEIADLGASLVAAAAEGLIAAGDLDPAGKTAGQISIEAAKKLLSRLKDGDDFSYSLSHQSTLLALARNYKRKKNIGVACLFYATWFEHWINNFLVRSRSKLHPLEKMLMLRDAPLRAKFSWLIVTLGHPRIPKAHSQRVSRIAEIRNTFVHYKWQEKPSKEQEEEDQRCEKELKDVEKTVRYLLGFEDKHILKNSRRVLAQIAPKAANRRKK